MSDQPMGDPVPCPECDGDGYLLDHDRRCPGGGYECERYCPVQVPCPNPSHIGGSKGTADG